MLFTEFPFLVLVALTFALYYLPGFRARQVHILVGASFLFYAWRQPWLAGLLFLSVAINAVSVYRVIRARERKQAKAWATAGVVLNMALLIFFKYTGFLARMVLTGDEGPAAYFLLHISLPIGISFFTFHGISLMVDVYKGKNWEAYRFIEKYTLPQFGLMSALYIAFFPQLVSGPIVKSYGFLPQIKPKFLREINWHLLVRQLITGYFLKVVVADNLNEQTKWISYPYFMAYDGLTLAGLILGYSMQIFADFAGYSLIALGLANLFGYVLPDNFNFPYISRSFQEFWTRWHISLSTWLREYLYFPLGGNRKGKYRTYINLMIVMFLGGLWHGAAWSYAIWGSFHGLALAVERFAADKLPAARARLQQRNMQTGIAGKPQWHNKKWYALWQIPVVFFFVTLAWLLFKLPDFSEAVMYMEKIFTDSGKRDFTILFYIALYSLPVILYHAWYLVCEAWPRAAFAGTWKAPLYGAMLFFIVVNAGVGGDFIYFQF